MSLTGRSGFSVGHACMDDVPFKLGEKCIPPRKVTMPLDFNLGNPTEALFMEYDFGLEAQVLHWMEVQRQHQIEAAEAKRAKLEQAERDKMKTTAKAQIEEAVKSEQSNDSVLQPSVAQAAPTPYFAPLSNGSILTPTPISVPSKSTIAPASAAASSTFDLADFEREQDPFENMELKVLDDMAELDKVLKESHVTQANTSVSSNGPLQSGGQLLKDVDYPDIDSLASSDSNVSLNTGGTAYFKPTQTEQQLPKPNTQSVYNMGVQVLPPIPTNNNLVQQQGQSTYMQSNYTSFPNYMPANVTSSSSNHWNPFRTSVPSVAPTSYMSQPNQNSNNNPNGLISSSYSKFGSSEVKADLSGSKFTSGSGLRSAKSTPDIPGLLGDDIKSAQRVCSHTPPPTRTYNNSTPPPKQTAKQDWNPYTPLPHCQKHNSNNPFVSSSITPPSRPPPPTVRSSTPPSRPAPPTRPRPSPSSSSTSTATSSASSKPSRPAPSLPDPYLKMNGEMRQFVDNITDMGFQRSRVARIVDRLGQDDKKVVDHLCAIGRLEENGFPPELSETALQLFENNQDKAKQYLTLLSQFKEFGFKEDKVRDALIRNNLDEDKTLDCLTASS